MKHLIFALIPIVIGIGFSFTGFRILFNKKFNYIEEYYENRMIYARADRFAKRHGFIDFIFGLIMIGTGIYGIVNGIKGALLIATFAECILVLVFLKLNRMFSKKK